MYDDYGFLQEKDLADVRKVFKASGLKLPTELSIVVENGLFYCPKDVYKPREEKELCRGTYFANTRDILFVIFKPGQCLAETAIFHELIHANFSQTGKYWDGDFDHMDIAWSTTLEQMEESYRTQFCRRLNSPQESSYIRFVEVE